MLVSLLLVWILLVCSGQLFVGSLLTIFTVGEDKGTVVHINANVGNSIIPAMHFGACYIAVECHPRVHAFALREDYLRALLPSYNLIYKEFMEGMLLCVLFLVWLTACRNIFTGWLGNLPAAREPGRVECRGIVDI